MRSPGDEPVALLLRSVLALGRRVRAERPPGSLSLSGLGILGTLNRQGTLVAARLAAAERLQPQSLTRLLTDLEDERLITRSRSQTDARALEIAITARGRQVLQDDMTVRRAWLEAAMKASLTAAERNTILEASLLMLKLAAYEPMVANTSA